MEGRTSRRLSFKGATGERGGANRLPLSYEAAFTAGSVSNYCSDSDNSSLPPPEHQITSHECYLTVTQERLRRIK